jgi:hypothetical protein
MQIYMFTSKRFAWVFGFTVDRTGANLPAEYAPWYALGRREMSGSGRAGGAETIEAEIGAHGYYLAQAGRNTAPKAAGDELRSHGGA